MKISSFCIMFLIALFVSTVPQTSKAQEFFGELLAGGTPTWTLRGVSEDSQPTRQQRFSMSAPINQVPSDPVNLTWKWSQLELGPDLKLENNEAVPTRFSSSEVGLNYKHNENQNHFWGFSVGVGSATDGHWSSPSKTIYTATGFYSMSDDPTARWLWFLNYSNNRSFLNEIPIPGLAYIYRPSADFMGVFGLPFALVRLKWNEQWSSQFFVGPYSYKAEISRAVRTPVQGYVSTERVVQSFYREAREKRDARVFYSEARTLLGIRAPLSAQFSMEFYAGVTHHRSVIESEEEPGYTKIGTRLDDRRLLGAQLTARF